MEVLFKMASVWLLLTITVKVIFIVEVSIDTGPFHSEQPLSVIQCQSAGTEISNRASPN